MNGIVRLTVAALAGVVLLAGQKAAGAEARRALEYAPAPVDNPLKGLVPYASDVRDRFPHSMEFNYLPLAALVTGPGQYDWQPLERLLNSVAGRGHQTIFRVYLEYPGHTNVIPDFLLQGGLKVHRYVNTNTQPFPPKNVETPDYEDARLRKVMQQFIAALGKKYDGDPRIGFITAGLLGTWGEWHDYPHDELFASKQVQAEVLDAYEAAFRTTPILVRYPAGARHARWADNAQRRLGYHDDSFAWSTIVTGKAGAGWHFMTLMQAAGPAALARWQTQPIGGEIRPEAWGKVFDPEPGNKQIQNFRQCVEATHVSWLMDSGMFQKQQSPDAERIKRAQVEVRRMGYEFHVPAVTVQPVANGLLAVQVEIENRGVAPFYADWPVEFGLLRADGGVVKAFKSAGKLTGLLPGAAPRVWAEKLDLQGVPAGTYQLALRVPNPLPQGHPVRFANATQDQHAPGWLTLTPVTWR